MDEQQLHKERFGKGFIAALGQSGGSTPKALAQYEIPPEAYSGDAEIFALMHRMRSRIITSPSFTGDRVLGAILFANTLDRQIGGATRPSTSGREAGRSLSEGSTRALAREVDSVQVMKPIPDLDALLRRATDKGTKVDFADRVGVPPIHFHDPAQLTDDLEPRGVTV